jgi:hypothetical protein
MAAKVVAGLDNFMHYASFLQSIIALKTFAIAVNTLNTLKEFYLQRSSQPQSFHSHYITNKNKNQSIDKKSMDFL